MPGALCEAPRLAGVDNKNFSEKMRRLGVSLEAFIEYPPIRFRLRNMHYKIGITHRKPSFQ